MDVDISGVVIPAAVVVFCMIGAANRDPRTLQIEITANLLLDKRHRLKYSPGFIYEEVGLYTRGPESLCVDFDPSASHEVPVGSDATAGA
ncbi:hypothetical protein [Variovorax sp. OV329]|uniref:hypothetical protein n=1 Tax=Variovorax sp. OV329 TaxID=1882825 RepID=UPI0008E0D9EB|nr:hypothetical protein [Variovorax sp. OV329]SFM02151.1 hypothetical protein SAMN05444747_10229 [Variovorax sp. OV329]